MNQESARRIFDYADGFLIWRPRPDDKPWTARNAGNRAGGKPKSTGYIRFNYFGKAYMAHRVIWIWHYGEIPEGAEIDHANRDRADNRIENLRIATRSQNSCNSVNRSNMHGCRGVVTYPNSRKFYARIAVNGKRRVIGSFETLEQARDAYVRASMEDHGGFSLAGNEARTKGIQHG